MKVKGHAVGGNSEPGIVTVRVGTETVQGGEQETEESWDCV